MRSRLSAFAEKPEFIEEATRAQEAYFSQVDEEILALDEEFLVERCFEWFIFDYPLRDHRTVLDLYRERYGLCLPLNEALTLVQWGEARGSLYEIKAVLPRRGLIVEDLFSGRRFKVHEPGLQSGPIVPGSVIHVRLLKVGAEYEFSTSAVGVPPAQRDRLWEWAREDYRRWRRNGAGGPDNIQEYLRCRSHRLNAQVIRVGLGLDPSRQWKPVRRERSGERRGTLLQGDVLRRVCGANEGRGRVEELLGLLRDVERESRPATPPTGTRVAGTVWPAREYATIAEQVARGLKDLGFGREIVQSTLRLWYDYCVQVRPGVKNPGAWVAAVIYGATRLKRARAVSQSRLAHRYGAAPSTVSRHFRSLAGFLSPSLREAGDRGKDGGTRIIEPLVDRILASLKL
ncbi:MAG: hypothetical protein QMC81_08610 [Thermoanaerobacterales bacterium]|nr:hypothetical protein [Bacillota bacterium]MDI6907531.1 hypothetical protein [Thermoanaerobacterales bacterium]